jgi:DNA-binding transcriptional regulator YiaG
MSVPPDGLCVYRLPLAIALVKYHRKYYHGIMDKTQLAEWRNARGMLSRDLAIKLGVSAPAVSRWESGKRPIPGWLPLALRGLDTAG